MTNKSNEKFFLPVELVMSLTLLGLLILSATLYYRAVKFQRFMEPMLAISKPKIKFVNNINKLMLAEFGKNTIEGINFTTNSIIIEGSAFNVVERNGELFGPIILGKLANILLSILKDREMISYIDLILVVPKISSNIDILSHPEIRLSMRQKSDLVLNSLYTASPELKNKYEKYFITTSVPVASQNKNNRVEFRFIATDRLHINIIQELGKYLH